MKEPFGSPILDAVFRLLVPFILLYAAYVVLHGHYSPGGGFQGGVIFAVAFILLRLIWGDHPQFGPTANNSLGLSAIGLLIFAGIGTLPLFLGRNYLDYGAIPLSHSEAASRAWLSLGAEIGIAIAVTGVILLIYNALLEGISN